MGIFKKFKWKRNGGENWVFMKYYYIYLNFICYIFSRFMGNIMVIWIWNIGIYKIKGILLMDWGGNNLC